MPLALDIYNIFIPKHIVETKYTNGHLGLLEEYFSGNHRNAMDSLLYRISVMDPDSAVVDELEKRGLSYENNDFTILDREGNAVGNDVDWIENTNVWAWHKDATVLEKDEAYKRTNAIYNQIETEYGSFEKYFKPIYDNNLTPNVEQVLKAILNRDKEAFDGMIRESISYGEVGAALFSSMLFGQIKNDEEYAIADPLSPLQYIELPTTDDNERKFFIYCVESRGCIDVNFKIAGELVSAISINNRYNKRYYLGTGYNSFDTYFYQDDYLRFEPTAEYTQVLGEVSVAIDKYGKLFSRNVNKELKANWIAEFDELYNKINAHKHPQRVCDYCITDLEDEYVVNLKDCRKMMEFWLLYNDVKDEITARNVGDMDGPF